MTNPAGHQPGFHIPGSLVPLYGVERVLQAPHGQPATEEQRDQDAKRALHLLILLRR